MRNSARMWAFLGLLAVGLGASAETVRFTNGVSVRGRVEDRGAYVTVRTEDGRALQVKRSLIESISSDTQAPRTNQTSRRASVSADASSPFPSLNRPISVDFQQMPLPDVVNYLRAETGLNFVIDPDVKADEITITLSLKDMKLINILRWIAYVGKLAVVIKGDGPTVRLAAKGQAPEALALYNVRLHLPSLIDRPAQPFNLAEGTAVSAPLGQFSASNQGGSIKRSPHGRDPQDIDLQRRGHDLVELITRITGPGQWDHVFVIGRLPERDYLAGE